MESIIIIVEAAAILLVVVGAISVSFFYIQKNRKLKLCHEFLRSQLELQEKSFDNIYREIHDNIGQSLSLVKLNLNTVETDPTSIATEKITYSKDLVGKAILDLRVLGKNLNANFIKEVGLNEAVKKELFRSAKNNSCKVILEEVGQPVRFKDYEELIIFRLFLDLFTISMHHFNAKKVTVRLRYQPVAFTLSVSTEGKLNPNATYPEFRSLYDRASLIGGDLDFKVLEGKGSVVKMVMAVREVEEEIQF